MGDTQTERKMNVGKTVCKGLEFTKTKCLWVGRKWVGKNVDGRKEWMGEK